MALRTSDDVTNFSTANGSRTEHVEITEEADFFRDVIKLFIEAYVQKNVVHRVHDIYILWHYHSGLEFVPTNRLKVVVYQLVRTPQFT